MDCTVFQVISKAVSALGDDLSQITQDILEDYGTTYLDLINCLNKIEAPEVVREVYYTVAANTTFIDPSSLGVTDFAEPEQIWERGNVSTLAVTGTTDATPIEVTFAGAVPATGQVELSGITNVPSWVNRDWYITKTGVSTATLNGSITPGATGGAGTASWSSDTFIPLSAPDYSPQAGPQPTATMGRWYWSGGKIYVPAANNVRQLWIQYLASPNPPASGPIGLCGGRELNFLAYGTAARFAPKRQLAQGPQCAEWAYGPSGEPDGSGGMLRDLITPIMLQRQGVQRRSKLFRKRRNGGYGLVVS